ncbi:multiprotein bridging factor aMBF1 [Methanococcus aeolicus]|uniref:Helix-turn-helix domain protein n=1 Tax=Methanococcus aeolicus (strain ATCC BAA-1280 / DSM 17508 / OCM 812 / Nankai-3) TaxID=419665 RepID=A6UVT8_META3|nr:multiprotein bridging factor aMBF1 [Methanococcus aeolicus]ABR56610.1 helix-turn-helix domain protein [Methanococcus aeolicus Nankai-3]UXM84615.1 multiprotein bridging factor aMBF1 [Methanococcus aeolicus]
MQCELCGKETTKLLTSRIEGVEMQVCDDCAKFGTIIQNYSRMPDTKGRRSGRGTEYSSSRPKKPRKDLFDTLKMVVEDYGTVIKQAREKRGWTLKELAKQIGIKESTLHKIERNELEPEEKYVKRLEKELNITLYEGSSEEYEGGADDSEFTLGDMIKIKRK